MPCASAEVNCGHHLADRLDQGVERGHEIAGSQSQPDGGHGTSTAASMGHCPHPGNGHLVTNPMASLSQGLNSATSSTLLTTIIRATGGPGHVGQPSQAMPTAGQSIEVPSRLKPSDSSSRPLLSALKPTTAEETAAIRSMNALKAARLADSTSQPMDVSAAEAAGVSPGVIIMGTAAKFYDTVGWDFDRVTDAMLKRPEVKVVATSVKGPGVPLKWSMRGSLRWVLTPGSSSGRKL